MLSTDGLGMRRCRVQLAECTCYLPTVITPYREYRVGDGEKKIPLWLDDVPVMAVGLDRWPCVGDRYVVAGELWRVVEITEKILCEREPN